MEPKERPQGSSDEQRTRKPYKAPELIPYGNVSKLTRSGGATRTEASSPRMRAKQQCV